MYDFENSLSDMALPSQEQEEAQLPMVSYHQLDITAPTCVSKFSVDKHNKTSEKSVDTDFSTEKKKKKKKKKKEQEIYAAIMGEGEIGEYPLNRHRRGSIGSRSNGTNTTSSSRRRRGSSMPRGSRHLTDGSEREEEDMASLKRQVSTLQAMVKVKDQNEDAMRGEIDELRREVEALKAGQIPYFPPISIRTDLSSDQESLLTTSPSPQYRKPRRGSIGSASRRSSLGSMSRTFSGEGKLGKLSRKYSSNEKCAPTDKYQKQLDDDSEDNDKIPFLSSAPTTPNIDPLSQKEKKKKILKTYSFDSGLRKKIRSPTGQTFSSPLKMNEPTNQRRGGSRTPPQPKRSSQWRRPSLY